MAFLGQLISSAFWSFASEGIGLFRQRDSELNTPAMQQAAEVQKDAKASDQIKTHIANQDEAATRADLS